MDAIEQQLRTALEAFWDERAIPTGNSGESTVDDLIGPVESMTAVDVLATLDAIVGFKIPNAVIQQGGYQTRSEFVNKLTGRVMDRFMAMGKKT